MAATTNNIGNIPSPPLNTGYNPEENVGVRGINQYATQIATANQSDNGIGGTGATIAPTRSFTPAPIVFAPKPVPPKTAAPPVPETPAYTPPPTPPVAVVPQALPAGPPAKDPQPDPPNIDSLVGRKSITERPDRYNVRDNQYTISALSEGVGAKPNIYPITLPKGSRPELKPLLKVDGIVVKAGEHYLVSPQTLADLTKSGNPHYDVVENGRVLETPMGKTVPVIEVNVANLPATGSKRDIVNSFAGVKSVDYIYETPTVMGISEGILDQINYTIDTDTQRPEDEFEIWEMNLTADYSIEKLTIDTAQEDGKLDQEKLRKFLVGINDRLKLLNNDFNIIKGVFYRGEMAEGNRKAPVKVRKRATSDDTDEEIQKPETSNYIIKTVDLVGTSATPLTAPETAAATTTEEPAAPELTGNAAENDAAIAKWNAYGFTSVEKVEIKNAAAANTAPLVKVADGSSHGIGTVRFGPLTAAKARVVLPITSKGNASQQSIFNQYYGTGLSTLQYYTLNRQRVAELLKLAKTIRELEEANGKIY